MTLRFQPTERQAWLVELDEHASRTQGDLCNRHAAALVLPRGWELHDERDLGPPAPLAADAPAPKAGGKGVRRVRVRRKGAPDVAPETAARPGLEPVTEPAVEPAPVAADDEHRNGSAAHRPVAVPFGVDDDDEVEQALGAILDARTPLLQRAFRNSRPLDTNE